MATYSQRRALRKQEFVGEAPFLKVSCATTTPEAPFLRSVGEGKIFLKGAGAPKLAERHKETSVRRREPLGTPAPESVCVRILAPPLYIP